MSVGYMKCLDSLKPILFLLPLAIQVMGNKQICNIPSLTFHNSPVFGNMVYMYIVYICDPSHEKGPYWNS